MGLRTVQFTTSTKIVCAGCNDSGAQVILCVNPEKVGFPECPAGMVSDNDDEQTYIRSYVEATINAVNCVQNNCSRKYYIYTFQYDDVQLQANQTLVPADITGVVCQDCLTQWVEDYVGNDVQVSIDEDGFVTIINQHGCEQTFLSGEAFNNPVEWAPEVTKNGGGTFTLDYVRDASYTQLGKWIHLQALIAFTITGSAINYINVSIPVAGWTSVDSQFFGGQFIKSGGTPVADGFGQINSTAVNLTMHSSLDAGFGIAAHQVAVNLWYRID